MIQMPDYGMLLTPPTSVWGTFFTEASQPFPLALYTPRRTRESTALRRAVRPGQLERRAGSGLNAAHMLGWGHRPVTC